MKASYWKTSIEKPQKIKTSHHTFNYITEATKITSTRIYFLAARRPVLLREAERLTEDPFFLAALGAFAARRAFFLVDADREVERLRLGERLGPFGTFDLRLGALAARRAFLRDTDLEVLGVRSGALGVFAFLLALRDTDLDAERFLAALGTLALRERLMLLLLLLFFDFFLAARGALARRLVDLERDLLVLGDALGAPC